MELGSNCRCLVTGGAGFIGSHICEELAQLGCDVISFDDYSAGKYENLIGVNAIQVNGDVTDYAAINLWMRDVDVVFHNAASKKNICLKDPRRDLEVNAKGTFNVLMAAKENKVSKIVHASTGSVYGEPIFVPQDEKHPLQPCSYYGVSKLAGESYCKVFRDLYDMDITILRYFHVYGQRQESGKYGGVVAIFDRLMKENKPLIVFGDGEQERSFTYVKDVVKANLAAVNYKNGVFNCASGLSVTLNDLILELSEIYDYKPVVKYEGWQVGDIKNFEVNNTLIKKELGIMFEDFKTGLWQTCNV